MNEYIEVIIGVLVSFMLGFILGYLYIDMNNKEPTEPVNCECTCHFVAKGE